MIVYLFLSIQSSWGRITAAIPVKERDKWEVVEGGGRMERWRDGRERRKEDKLELGWDDARTAAC